MVLPDPWIPNDPHQHISAIGGFAGLATGTFLNTNESMYLPVVFPCDATLYALRFLGANATGNYDLGLYRADLSLIASKGTTAMSAAIQELSLSNLRVKAGELYYAAYAISNSSATALRMTVSVGLSKGVGWGHEASAMPLPSTATPVSTTAYAAFPVFAFGVR